jgi:hypothetical protein
MDKMHTDRGRGEVIKVIVKFRGAYYEQVDLIKKLSRSRRDFEKLGNKEHVEAYDIDIARRKQASDFLLAEIKYLKTQLGKLDQLDEVA